jgi:hypothetical protein
MANPWRILIYRRRIFPPAPPSVVEEHGITGFYIFFFQSLAG